MRGIAFVCLFFSLCWFAFVLNFASTTRWLGNDPAASKDLHETKDERELFQDAPKLDLLFQTGPASSAAADSEVMMTLLERLTIAYEQGAMECSHVPELMSREVLLKSKKLPSVSEHGFYSFLTLSHLRVGHSIFLSCFSPDGSRLQRLRGCKVRC